MPRTPGRKKPAIKNEASFAKRKRGSGAYRVCVARMNASGLAPGSLLTKALGPRRPASRRSGECEAPILAPMVFSLHSTPRSRLEKIVQAKKFHLPDRLRASWSVALQKTDT
jgi:hypothetical protein